jgi:hypothetical protein
MSILIIEDVCNSQAKLFILNVSSYDAKTAKIAVIFNDEEIAEQDPY